MSYRVKELFATLQGEGARSGRRAVFCRFAGCNGWTGREADRGKGPLACSAWCDTDFVGTDGANGGRYAAAELAAKCSTLWGDDRTHRYVVLTGGEPMLQVDGLLIDALHRFGFKVAVETNGTRACPDSLDWVTVSPKAGGELVQVAGQELKLVYPQPGAEPERYAGLAFRHFFLQPMWTADEGQRLAHIRAAADYCLGHPQWRLGLQIHKAIGLP
jgi:7-carboxy-7-deazaguanine synthase